MVAAQVMGRANIRQNLANLRKGSGSYIWCRSATFPHAATQAFLQGVMEFWQTLLHTTQFDYQNATPLFISRLLVSLSRGVLQKGWKENYMAFERLWDQLNNHVLEEIAQNWVLELRKDLPEDDREYASRVKVVMFTATQIQLWQFLMTAIEFAHSEHELAEIAAGPLAYFLRKFGEEFSLPLETQAQSNSKLVQALGMIEATMVPESVWQQILTIREESAS